MVYIVYICHTRHVLACAKRGWAAPPVLRLPWYDRKGNLRLDGWLPVQGATQLTQLAITAAFPGDLRAFCMVYVPQPVPFRSTGLSGLLGLRALALDYTRQPFAPEELSLLTGLECLSLRGSYLLTESALSEPLASLEGLQCLRELGLSECRMSRLPLEGISSLQRLTVGTGGTRMLLTCPLCELVV